MWHTISPDHTLDVSINIRLNRPTLGKIVPCLLSRWGWCLKESFPLICLCWAELRHNLDRVRVFSASHISPQVSSLGVHERLGGDSAESKWFLWVLTHTLRLLCELCTLLVFLHIRDLSWLHIHVGDFILFWFFFFFFHLSPSRYSSQTNWAL